MFWVKSNKDSILNFCLDLDMNQGAAFPTRLPVDPGRTQISLIWVFAGHSVCSEGSKASSDGQWRLWSYCTDTWGDLSLLWVHMQSCRKCCVHSHICFVHWLYPRHRKYAMGVYSFCLFCASVSLSVNIYFVSKISQELLYLETWNFVHMTSMTSCIVGKKIRAMGPGPLELFPFVVLAILMAMAGGINEHMLTSRSSFSCHSQGKVWVD